MVAAYATVRARPGAAPWRPHVMPELPDVIITFGLGAGLALLGSVPMTGPLALLVIDRLIVAQAQARGAPLITRDRLIRKHYARAIWDSARSET